MIVQLEMRYLQNFVACFSTIAAWLLVATLGTTNIKRSNLNSLSVIKLHCGQYEFHV